MSDDAADFEEYAARFPRNVQQLLKTMRQAIHEAAPQARETISYRMPAFKLKRILVWYGAHVRHIGFYPGAAAIAAFADELASYASAKGSVKFPFDRPLPLDVVRRIVTFRVRQEQTRAEKGRQALTS